MLLMQTGCGQVKQKPEMVILVFASSGHVRICAADADRLRTG